MNETIETNPDAVVVESPAVACDGGGALGHPRVYLRIGPSGEIVCPYCSRRFVLAEGAASDAGH
ncbi:MAG: zinc-finger domain-containing protein [Rhodospirillales bacterium]|nr:zinc-finger domain-containing protein [Rhodospirillales bacterium]